MNMPDTWEASTLYKRIIDKKRKKKEKSFWIKASAKWINVKCRICVY